MLARVLLAHHDHRDRLSCFVSGFDQRGNAIGNSSASPSERYDRSGFFFRTVSDRVEETNALDEATVACITAVGDNNW